MVKNSKYRILIVDDTDMNRLILSDILSSDYEIVEATNGKECIDIINTDPNIDLILLDIIMPIMDGYETLKALNKMQLSENVPVIVISAENSQSYIESAYSLGAVDYITRPFYPSIVLRKIANTILLYAKQKKLVQLVEDQIYQKHKSNNLMVLILSHIVEFRNGESGLHVLHIRTITNILLRQLAKRGGEYQLPFSKIELIANASSLHDIGKISIDEKILNKPGRLTPEEYNEMKKHTVNGAEMLAQLPFYKDEELVKCSYEICRWHHERFDGRGYPDGLKGNEIPLSAQVVSIADVYDALTSERVYKKAFTHDEAIKMILNNECGVFNPVIVECLLEVQNEIKKELKVSSLNSNSYEEIHRLVSEVLSFDEVMPSKTIQVLQQERNKYEFFSSLTDDVLFEIDLFTNTLVFSSDPTYYGLDYKVDDPANNKIIKSMFGDRNIINITKSVNKTTQYNPTMTYECKIIVNNEPLWIKLVCKSVWSDDANPKMISLLGKIINNTDDKKKMNELHYLASHDSLTNLLNKTAAFMIINNILFKNPRNDYVLAVFDIDDFKSINDSFGHLFGDEVLKRVAGMLVKSTKHDYITARIGGDEFLVFFRCRENSECEEIISKIHSSICSDTDGFKIEAAVGVARTTDAGRKLNNLFKCADKALYYSKENGKNQYNFYNENMKDILVDISDYENIFKNNEN